jgi:Transposase IS4
MSAFRPRTDKTGGLPNISFIQRKPEPLGVEFKVVSCSKTGIMLNLEVQRGKEEMPKRSKYHREYGATTSCTMRGIEATINIGRKEEEFWMNLFTYDSCFASVKTCAEVAVRGQQGIGPVKTAKKFFPAEDIEEKMRDWPGGTHLVMKDVEPYHQKTLLATGYKCNGRKVLTFVATDKSGNTLPGDPYCARWKDDTSFSNARPVSRPHEQPQIVSNYFKKVM